MADGVLPAASVFSVERKLLHDVRVDLVERELSPGRALDGHGDEGDVGEWWSLVDLQDSLLPVANNSCQNGEGHGAGVVYGVE